MPPAALEAQTPQRETIPGHPPRYDQDAIMEQVIAELETGKPLSVICRATGMPSRQTIKDWCDESPALGLRVAHARLLGEEAILEEVVGIADDITEDPASRKVRVWSRLEALKRFNPSRYGDKAEITHTGTIEHRHTLTEGRRLELMERRRLALDVTPGHDAGGGKNLQAGGREGEE